MSGKPFLFTELKRRNVLRAAVFHAYANSGGTSLHGDPRFEKLSKQYITMTLRQRRAIRAHALAEHYCALHSPSRIKKSRA
ncbi:MAG: hypothetical protein JSS21_03790 [Proteobacteria bacterium]|nr:hypothetical protein [Pseudomonadota bacterium]